MEEINRINEILPHTDSQGKTSTIQQWIESVIQRIECYKVEHLQLLKEAMALLELALWKAKLFDVDEDMLEPKNADDGKEGSNGARKEQRITSGASIRGRDSSVLEGHRIVAEIFRVHYNSGGNSGNGSMFLIMILAPEVMHLSFLALLIRPLVTLSHS
eukprot:scaffold5293_cov112-Skeletonema_dohrnii-CCMP3373.AAC.1